jgi:two-component system, chemotaxis family, CheB/CheR fusion protein
MHSPGTGPPNNHDLRLYLRDLAAVTELPAVWSGADRRRIADGMAEVVVSILHLDFAFVRLECSAAAEMIEAVHFAQLPTAPLSAAEVGTAMAPYTGGRPNETAIRTVAHPLGSGSVNAAVTPIGYGSEFGVLLTASVKPDYPAEEDRLLLNVIANQAAIVLQRSRADEARTLLAAVVESSEDAIVSKTLEGRILSWNRGAERLFGYTAAEAIGQPIYMIIPPERHAEERMILDRLVRGERIEHYETVRITKDGRRLDISLTISPVRDAAGRIFAASKVARDITLRKRADAALQEADHRKDEFLATLAHELRNPLAPIRNAVHILATKAPPTKDLQWVREVLDRQVQQMTRLVDDLLDVSRIGRGKIDMRKERTDLIAVINYALEASKPLIEKWGHELTVRLTPGPVSLDGDPARLAQVLSNLLNNAAKYTEQGGKISVTVECEGQTAVIRIKDTGVGIPADMLPRIFDMFMQVDRSLERARGGLGIGLSLVQKLVELHGGTVTAFSPGPGQGSEFVVRLPLVDDCPPDDKAKSVSAKQASTAAAPRRRILVVDDNKDAADSLGMLLRILGNDVQIAYDGLQAVTLAAEFRPQLVLMDIGLPKLNGYEAARRIREQPGGRDVTLVALTGWGQDEDRRRSHEAGFDRHMTKPVESDVLEELLASLK